MRPTHVLLTLLLCCLPATAVDVGSGVVFNFTDTSITTGTAHSWTSFSVHSEHVEMGSNAFCVNPTHSIAIWNWVWDGDSTFNASCASGEVWFNATNSTWGNGAVKVYVNDTLNDTISASGGMVRFLYDGGWSEKYFRFEPMGDTSTYVTHLTATTPGTAANSITTTTTCGNASFGAATLTGGSDSDSEWAGSDVPTGVDIWRDGAGMIVIVVLALLAGIVIVCLRGGGIGEGLTISPNAAIGLAVGLLVLVAIFGIAPIFGDRIDSVADLGQETYATGRLAFALDGTTADGETVTIDATTLEFDRSADGVTAGRIPVNISDSTAATASLNLTAAINGNATLAAVVVARRDIST